MKCKVIICLFCLSLLCGCSDENQADPVTTQEQVAQSSEESKSETETQTTEVSSVEETTTEQSTEIEYQSVDVEQLIQELENNALKASQNYRGKNVAVYGRLSNIDSDGAYFNVSGDSLSLYSVQCYVKKNKTILDTLSNLSIDTYVTVYGKITDVGEIMGYSLDVTKLCEGNDYDYNIQIDESHLNYKAIAQDWEDGEGPGADEYEELYILPYSDTIELTDGDVNILNAKELTYARNEIYARHGYVFKSAELNEYFNSKSWYTPDPSFDGTLSKIENKNVAFLKKWQDDNGLQYQLDK